MSDAMNKLNIDVGDALRKGSNEVGVSDLSRMGLTKVKVIRHSQVNSLISESVDKAINRFLAGTVGQAEQQKLRALISKKETALTDVSGEEQARLSTEVEMLKRKLDSQATLVEAAKEKVIEDSKKEYERLAEKTSLENQLLQQKKVESDLRQQLQEMTLKVGDYREKLQNQDVQIKEGQLKLQDMERVRLLQEELNELDEENATLKDQISSLSKSLEIEKEKSLIVERSIGENRKGADDLQVRLDKVSDEKQAIQNRVVELETRLKMIEINDADLKSSASERQEELRDSRKQLEESKGLLSEEKHAKGQLQDKVNSLEAEKQDLQLKVFELTKELNEKSAGDQNAMMMDAFKNMMSEMKGELSDKIGKIKYRGGSGGGGGGVGESIEDMDPSVLMKSLFSGGNMESNIGKINLDNRKASPKKDMAKNMDKLKALKNLTQKKDDEESNG